MDHVPDCMIERANEVGREFDQPLMRSNAILRVKMIIKYAVVGAGVDFAARLLARGRTVRKF